MSADAMGLRERTRRAVRAEIVAVATELFMENGFEPTTVEDVAKAASISRSSFFRYFATKEDVVLQLMADAGEQVAGAIATRPPDEAPWTCLRRAFDDLVDETDAHPQRAREVALLVQRSPVLRAAHLQRRSSWSTPMLASLEPRLRDRSGARSLRAAALVGASLACLEAANDAWVADTEATSFGTLLDEAMLALAPLPD